MTASISARAIGSQIAYGLSVLEARRHPFDAGLRAEQVEKRAALAAQFSRVVMQVVVSLIVLVAGVYLLVVGNEPTQKVASGLIGTVMGYWLR